MMRILSCLIRISHCPCLLRAMLAAHSAVDYKYWMLSRWATLKSPSTLLYQRTTPSFPVFFLVTIHFKSQSADLPQSPTHSNKMQFTLLTSIIMACSTSVFFVVDIQLKNQWLFCSRCSGVCIPCAGSSRSPRPSSSREYMVVSSATPLLTVLLAPRGYRCCSWSWSRGKSWAHLRAI